MKYLSALTAFTLLASCATTLAQSQLVFQDNFQSGSSAGWHKWVQSQTTLTVANSAMAVNNAGNLGRQVEATFADTSLNVGESLTLKFNIKIDNVVDSPNTIRFGLFNNNGTELTEDTNLLTTDAINTDNIGYWAALDSRSSGATGTAIIYNDTAISPAFNLNPPAVTFPSLSQIGVIGSEYQTVIFSINRLDSAYQIGISINNSTMKYALHESGGQFPLLFNTVAFYTAYTGGADYSLSGITITKEMQIPEPAAVYSIAGLLLLLGLRHLKRKSR